MNVIFRQATIIDPESPWHKKVADVIVENGKISDIGTHPTLENFKEVALENLHISQGWFDSSVSFGEPGFEDRETIANGLDVAAKSGFTGVALQPNSHPVIDNQSQVQFVKLKSAGAATDLYPIGALTKNSGNRELAELYDMKKAGAFAFGDYNINIENSNLLKIALQYVQDFDGVVIAFSEDGELRGNGVVHEGNVSTRLGLRGIPALAEEIAVSRSLSVLEYTGGKLHIPTISTGRSVQLIRDAKSKGLNVTCSVSVHHLVLTDERLEGFDSRYKVAPPLRDEKNRKMLLDAAIDGTIDMITSDHNPIDIEHKNVEFDLAMNGTVGLESAFGALLTVLPLEAVVRQLTSARRIFNLGVQCIDCGNMAGFTLFNPDMKWQFGKDDIFSKSKNSAFLKTAMTGKAYGIYNNGKLVLA